MNLKLMTSVVQTDRFLRLIKEGSWIFFGQVVTVIGSLVLVKVLSEYLEPYQYGQLALGLTVAGLIQQLVVGGITNGIGRFYSVAAEKNDLYGYLRASRMLMGYVTGGVLAVGVTIVAGLYLYGYVHWVNLVVAVLIFSLLTGYNSSINGIQNAARQRSIVAIHNSFNSWLKIFFAVILMYIFGKNSTVVVCGYVCAVFLVTCSQLFFLKKVIGSQAVYSQKNENWKKQIWDFAWPLYAWGIFTWLHLASDRWALQNFASIEDVGLYAVLFQVGYSPILMLINMVMNFLGPVLYQRAGDATDLFRVISVNKIAHRLAIISLGISFFAFGILNFSHEFIFKLFVGENYLSISYLLPGIVLAGGVFGSGQVISVNIAALKMSKERIPVKIGTAFIGVLFNVVGAKLYGIEGVVFSLVGFAFLYFLWMLFLLHKLKRNFI